MGTMSIDFMVMGLPSILPKSPNHLFHADRKWMIPARGGACPSRWTAALGCAAEQKRGDERLTCFFALMAMRIMGFDEWPRAGWGGPQATLSSAGVSRLRPSMSVAGWRSATENSGRR